MQSSLLRPQVGRSVAGVVQVRGMGTINQSSLPPVDLSAILWDWQPTKRRFALQPPAPRPRPAGGCWWWRMPTRREQAPPRTAVTPTQSPGVLRCTGASPWRQEALLFANSARRCGARESCIALCNLSNQEQPVERIPAHTNKRTCTHTHTHTQTRSGTPASTPA